MKRKLLSLTLSLVMFVVILSTPQTEKAHPQKPFDVWNGICQATGGIAQAPIISAFCQITDKLVTAVQPKDPMTLRELSLKVGSLETELKGLEEQVAGLTFELRREEVLSLTRAVDQERAHLQAALDIAVDHPTDTSAETQALSAAQALGRPAFYTLPGRTAGAADRFDPRVALPSFVLAVESWLAIRAAAKAPATDTSRQRTAEFPGRLAEITGQMRASLHCEEVFRDFERFTCEKPKKPKIPTNEEPDPGPAPTPICTAFPACTHRISCTDDMEGVTNASGDTVEGVCVGRTNENAQRNHATRLADYHVEAYEAIARRWLASVQ